MIGTGAAFFATCIAARYATRWARAPLGRVLVHPRAAAPPRWRRASTPLAVTVGIRQRWPVEHRRTVRHSHHALLQRVERHVTATRHVVERTRRVEQVALHSPTLQRLIPRSEQRAAPAAPIVVPALPRVLRRPASPRPEGARVEPARAAPTPAFTVPQVDLARLTDEVMRGIDRRVAAWRERRGRV